jgi:hypothetical protein
MAEAAPTATGGFGEGDPRNAQYFQTLASLNHQYNTTLANDKETLSNAESNANYQRGLLGQKEPLSYKANQHRSNAGGLLESGVNAERRGTIGAEYSNRRGAIAQALQKTQGSVSKADQGALENRQLGEGQAAITGYKEGAERVEKEPTNQFGPVNPGGVRTITGTGPEFGYRETSKAGSVAVGSGTRYARELREKAAKKAVG